MLRHQAGGASGRVQYRDRRGAVTSEGGRSTSALVSPAVDGIRIDAKAMAGIGEPTKGRSWMAAVVFDMDGVIIDSEPYWHVAEIEVFGSVGVPLTTEMCKQTTGLLMSATVDHWYERYPWTGPAKLEIERRAKVRAGELVARHGCAIEGALQLIAALRAAGVPLAVCSSSPLFLIECVCEKLGIRRHFQFLQSAEDCVRGKPHPDPYLAAAAGLRQPPARCVAIEDSLNGMRSAKAAGMRVVGFTDSLSPADSDLCDVVCESLLSLRADSILALVE